MGSFLSLHGERIRNAECDEHSQHGTRKRQRIVFDCGNNNVRLIPSLPDEISFQILARLPRIYYLDVKLVSRSWKAAITSGELFQLRKELRTTEEWLYVLKKVGDGGHFWYALDPNSGRWQRLPPMPVIVDKDESRSDTSIFGIWSLIGSTIRLADTLKSWIQHKDAMDQLSLCGCAVGSVDGCIYVLGGFVGSSAIRCVLKYDPQLNAWSEVNSMSCARAYCKTAMLNGKLYAVGGVHRIRGGLTPLHSAEVFDPYSGIWTQVPSMTFSKANVLPAALFADIIKPIATGMTSYRGQLCVPQSLYTWPFFVDVGGEIYDPKTNSWSEMPAGMGEGWPARQAGTKLSAVVNGVLYALDPSSSPNSGAIKVYDPQEDAWKVAIAEVPVPVFANSESPYLLVGIHGKLHTIMKESSGDTTIFQADFPGNGCCPSSCPSLVGSSTQRSDPPYSGEKEMWKIIASKNFGAADLVSCQVLHI